MSRAMYFNFSGYSGWSVLWALFPKSCQTRWIARAWVRALREASKQQPDLEATQLVIQLPWGSFRIVSHDGKTKRCNREGFPI